MKDTSWFSFKAPRKLFLTISCLAIAVAVPLLVDNWLSGIDKLYTELLRDHECGSKICVVDFDGDGSLGHVFIDRSTFVAPQEYHLIATDNGKEVMRLPYWELDDNARTHVATHQSYASGKSHLVIYENKGSGAPVVSVTYAWGGSGMIQIPPSEFEKLLFKAMAGRDQNGAFNHWVLYRMLRIPTLMAYFALLIIIVTALARKNYRARETR